MILMAKAPYSMVKDKGSNNGLKKGRDGWMAKTKLILRKIGRKIQVSYWRRMGKWRYTETAGGRFGNFCKLFQVPVNQ